MVRPFAPRDILRLRRRQATGTALDFETATLPGRSPLQAAIAGLVPWRGPSFYTLILDPSDASYPEGFLQARVHPEGEDADLVYIAPSLDSGQRAAISWHRLISEAGHWLGARGLRKLHVCTDADDRLAGQVLRQLGFHDHSNETLMRLGAPPGGETDRPSERAGRARSPRSSLGGGSWLCWPHPPRDEASLRAMVLEETQRAEREGRLPIYAAARSENAVQRRVLSDLGFEPCGEGIRWVRATTAHVMEPAWRESLRHEPGKEAAGSGSPRA